MTDIRAIDVQEILPQRPPFVMIDRLEHYDEVDTVSSLEVKEGGMFVEDGVLMPCGIMENIAQTCAARIGYVQKYILGKDIRIGYIGEVKNLSVVGAAPVGGTLMTTISVRMEFFDITMVDARVECDGRVIATATMKIALN